MNLKTLLSDLERLEIRLEAHGDKLRFFPTERVTDDLAVRMKIHKTELLKSLQAGQLVDSSKQANKIVECESLKDENEFYWQQINQEDRDYLLSPRNWPEPCPWCAGRTSHSKGCQSMQSVWEPKVEFGKHRGKNVSEIDPKYIQWIIDTQAGSDQFRHELQQWLKAKRQ